MNIFERQCQILGINAASSASLWERVRDGLPAQTILRLERAGLDKQVVFEILGSPGTLRRRLREGSRLTQVESDRAARLAELIAHAERLFGDNDKAMYWLNRPSIELDRTYAPAALARTSVGADMVRERLFQAEHGMCA